MSPPEILAQSRDAPLDPELDAVLKKVLQLIYRDHPLQANQILILASELQRIGVHRLVEEHIEKFRQGLERKR